MGIPKPASQGFPPGTNLIQLFRHVALVPDWAPEDRPAEVTMHRYEIEVSPGLAVQSEIMKVAEFWLNVADGDALWALVLAGERMTEIVDRESYGFRRGRSVVMPTGLSHDEEV